MTDVYTKAKRSEIMSRVKNKRTAPEDRVALILRALGIRYRRNVKTLPGKPDFVVSAKRTVIFVNGCFWHGHRNCKRSKLPGSNRDFWKEKIRSNRRRDARTARALRRQGWRVWTIWQCHLRNPEAVRQRLRELSGDKALSP